MKKLILVLDGTSSKIGLTFQPGKTNIVALVSDDETERSNFIIKHLNPGDTIVVAKTIYNCEGIAIRNDDAILKCDRGLDKIVKRELKDFESYVDFITVHTCIANIRTQVDNLAGV